MIRFILALSSLACLASAELCFDGKDIALACTAGTEFGQRLMEAIDSCDYNMRSALESGGDKTWQEVLGLTRNLTLSPRQTTCPTVEEMEEYVMRYASNGLCLWKTLGWHDLWEIGVIYLDQYQEDIDSLHPAVSYPLQWYAQFGECWSDTNNEAYDYSCNHYLRDQIWNLFGQLGVTFAP